MDWVHCNSCYEQPNEQITPKQQFYLTSCGHIFCHNCGCFADGSLDCCKICMNKCSSTLIGEESFQTNPEVLEYFQEPDNACEKLLRIMKFQKAHRIKLVKHHQSILSKYNRAKLYIKKLENELKIVKNALRNTPQKPYSIKTESNSISMPIFHPNSTPFKMIDAEAKTRNAPSIKQKLPDLRHRKQSFRNELSMLSSASTASGIHTPGSSVYASPLQYNSDEKCILPLDKLHLSSSGHRYKKIKTFS